ncbi:MAG: DMT family transporter [Prevotella sp.]|nr:DMT family transporter [Prevotella sp.]
MRNIFRIFARKRKKRHEVEETRTSIFQRPGWVVVFALTAAIAWGWAFPLIKVGFSAFGITADMTGSKMLFAGIRFMVAGLIVLSVARSSGRPFRTGRGSDWWFILAFALMNTTLHYFFFYVGMSHSEGSRAAILNSLSTFLVVLLACACFKSDMLTPRKLIGCAVGFCGILALNLGGDSSGRFTWLGDGMIVLNAFCGAAANLMTRGLSRRVDVFVGTGYSLALGGVLLIVPGLALGGTLPTANTVGIVCLLLLIAISALGFTLYNKLLSLNPVGRVAIYNSLIPIVGAVTSCLCLGETFYAKYALAGGLAAIGIYTINKGKN